MSVDGSLPLSNERHERFAQLRADGVSNVDAWRAAAPHHELPSRASAKSCGFRASKRSEVADRIKHLQSARKRATETGFDLSDPVRWGRPWASSRRLSGPYMTAS